MAADIDDFKEVKQCTFKEEVYSVRDNGAVLRHPKEGGRKRPTDNKWSFGNPQKSNPYLVFGKDRVHRIVATAFLGEPEHQEMIVDHIDTNGRNNRPENLRWITRLENALSNEMTKARIELACGSIESFLANPRQLDSVGWLDRSQSWMRTVTPEEAEVCRQRMGISLNKMKSEKPVKTESDKPKTKRTIVGGNTFKDRVFKPLQKWEVGLDGEPGLDLSSTHWCGYFMWSNINSGEYFPTCPPEGGDDHFQRYFNNLIPDAVLSSHDKEGNEPALIVMNAKKLTEYSMVVLVSRNENLWSIIGIDIGGSAGFFVHYVLGTFDNFEGAMDSYNSKNSSTDLYKEGYGGDMRF